MGGPHDGPYLRHYLTIQNILLMNQPSVYLIHQTCTPKMYLIPNTLKRFNSKQRFTLSAEYLTPLQKYLQ